MNINKYLILILFAFSCTNIDRVHDETDDGFWSNLDEKVMTKKTIEVNTEADKLIVEKKEVETQYYKDIDPKTSRAEVRRVEFLKSNKFGVKYAYAIMDIDDNRKIMDKEYDIKISTFVDTGNGDWDDRECTFVENYYDILPEDLEAEKVKRLEEVNKEFEKLINKIIKNTNE